MRYQMRIALTREGAVVPSQANPGDAGYDLTTPEKLVIMPWRRLKVPTGVRMEIPPGHFGLMMSRSSLCARGIHAGPGVVDSGYRGEVYVVLENVTGEVVTIEAGQRIAQIVLVPYLTAGVTVVDELADSERGDGGFGSTGL